MSNKSKTVVLAKIFMTVLAFFWLSRGVNWQMVCAAIGQLSLITACSVVFIILLVNVLISFRWYVILRSLSVKLNIRELLSFTFSAMFLNQVIPSGAAGDALRTWYLVKRDAPVKVALSSVILDRFMTLISLMVFVVLLHPYLTTQIGELAFITTIWIFIVTAIFGLIVVLYLSSYLEHLSSFALAREVFTMAHRLREEFFKKPTHVVMAALITVLSFSLLGLAVYLLSQDMGVAISLFLCLALSQPVFLVSSVPISIAGWGLREGMMVTAFSYVAVDPAQSIAVSLCFGIALLIGTMPGALTLALTNRTGGVRLRKVASV